MCGTVVCKGVTREVGLEYTRSEKELGKIRASLQALYEERGTLQEVDAPLEYISCDIGSIIAKRTTRSGIARGFGRSG